jgi:glutamate synthase domain-containing protein 3
MTSSLGRALATAAALHGGEMASSDELEKANNNNKNIEEKQTKTDDENKDKNNDQEKWQKITENYLRNIDEMKSQSMCMHWFNNNKDVLKNMKTIVPRMYGEIEEHYQKKLNSLQQ